jgi:hypothetical protein
MPNGGVIGPENVPTVGSASGVWSLSELYDARLDNVWPFAAPDVVLNASVWLDAADLSTITESGGAVSQWNNKGSLGNFTQGTGANQPTTGVSTLNSLNVIDFASDFMTSADSATSYKFLHDGTDYIVAAVVKFGTTANPNTTYSVFDNGGSSTSTIGVLFWYSDEAGVNDALQHFVTRGVSSTRSVTNTADNAITPNQFTIASLLADPNNGTAANRSLIYVDDGSAVDNNTQTNAVSTSDPASVLYLGSRNNGVSNILTGSIAEIVIVSGADATEGNRVIIRNYLNAKWGVYV